tara:strand:+ start:1391 stop:1918 length:528 start_codon:yes stop_codon:yes gene_type:complete
MKTFVILGMHRSATSLVAKGLNNVIYLGEDDDMLPPQEDNPEGFYENNKFIDLNNEIISAAGGNWLEPPSEKAILSVKDEFTPKIKKLISEFNDTGDYWGWKDPRTVLTIRLFHPYLINPHYIACFRQPLEVAKSLNKRNMISIQKGLRTAMEYNFRIIKFLNDKHLKIDNHETK